MKIHAITCRKLALVISFAETFHMNEFTGVVCAGDTA